MVASRFLTSRMAWDIGVVMVASSKIEQGFVVIVRDEK